jgi:hypothetical protein
LDKGNLFANSITFLDIRKLIVKRFYQKISDAWALRVFGVGWMERGGIRGSSAPRNTG